MGTGRSTYHAGLSAVLALTLAGTAVVQESDGLLERALSSRAKGPDSAAVTVYEIADFQCPYCARFATDLAPRLDEEYVQTGRVQWVFVNLPLHTHSVAWPAAEAALCAGAVGDAFWPMHDRLFMDQDEWAEADDPMAMFVGYAEDLELPGERFLDCMVRDRVATLLLQDVTSVVGAQISGTPTFIIMRGREVVQRLVGIQTVKEWQAVLDGALEG